MLTDALSSLGVTWELGKHYPKWVDLDECALDQFYTDADSAKRCYLDLCSFLDGHGIGESECLFIEPAAGTGTFASLLPPGSVTLDLCPASADMEQADFLTWDFKADGRVERARAEGKHVIAIGNPPFGARGWMALSFLNKCATFADYCAFLLPMSFASEGKGSPKYRVKGMKLAQSCEMLNEMFELPDKTTKKLNVVWQIWEKGKMEREDFSDIDEMFEIHFCCDLPYRKCGQAFKETADIFVPQAFFPGALAKPTQDWDEVLYDGAYGIKARDESLVDALVDALSQADWTKYSTFSTHGCRHIGASEIKRALADAFSDEKDKRAQA